MDIIYHNEPYLPLECAQLLARALAPADTHLEERALNHIDVFSHKLQGEHPARYPQLQAWLQPLRTVSAYVCSRMSVSEERLRFYFAAPPDCHLLPGLALALLEREGVQAEALSETARRKLVMGFVSGDDQSFTVPADEGGLSDWLEKQGLSAGDRWTCLRLCQRMGEYQAECRAILTEAAKYYLELRPVWAPVLEQSVAAFREKLEAVGDSYLAEHFHVKFDFHSVELYPSLSGFNMLSLFNFGDRPGGRDVYLLDFGYLLDELSDMEHESAYQLDELSAKLKSIGDRRRLDILSTLRDTPLCGQEIAQQVGLTPATVSHHMNELVSSGFVDIVKVGTRVNYLYSSSGMARFLQDFKRLFHIDET